ncbi:hypothetical protein Bbelb_191590 [Branchiostoma belcheri]|nr:hypothetical protein Bbelb_191590 [Branchiostoma belcheri]
MRCSMASPVAMATALVVALLCCQATSFHAPHKGTARFRSNPPSADARDRTLRAVYSDWEGGGDEEESPGEDDYYPDWPAAPLSDREPVWVDQKPGPAAASAKQQKPAKATASKATPAPQPPPGFPPPPGLPHPPGFPLPPERHHHPEDRHSRGADKAGETKGGKNATGPADPQSPVAGQPILPVPIPGSPILGPAAADVPPDGGQAPGQADVALGLAGSSAPSSLKDVEELLKAMRKLAAAKKRQKTPGLRPGDPGDHTNLNSKSQDRGEQEDRGEETSCGEQLSSKDVALIRKNNDLIKEVLRTVHELKTSLLNSEKVENSPDKASRSGRHHHKKSHTDLQEVSTRQREGVDENEGHHSKFHHSKEQKEPENDSDWTKNSENANMEESQNHHSKNGHKHNKNVRQHKETEQQKNSKQGKTFGDDKKHGNHHHREHTKVGRQGSETEDTNHIQVS